MRTASPEVTVPAESASEQPPVADVTPSAAASAAASASASAVAPTVDCGYTPETGHPTFDRAAYLDAGCGVAPESPDAWRTVTEISVVEVRLEPQRTVLAVVLLDAEKRRVIAADRQVRYDVALRSRHRGHAKLKDAQQRDGIFEITLPKNERPAKACTLSIHVEFDTATGKVEDWVDDWMYGC